MDGAEIPEMPANWFELHGPDRVRDPPRSGPGRHPGRPRLPHLDRRGPPGSRAARAISDAAELGPRRRPRSRPRRFHPSDLIEVGLPQSHRFRGDLDALVLADELDRLLK